MKSFIAALLVALALAAATSPASAWSLPGPLNFHAQETIPSVVALVATWIAPVAPTHCATTLAGRVCADG